jgi:threonine/homoserine/homoserine lactone efflux protein
LSYLGLRTLLARFIPSEARIRGREPGILGAYGSTLFLTLTNPMTILLYTAILAGAGLSAARPDYGSAALLVGGIFMGSALWWLLLSGAVSIFRSRITPVALQWINRTAGAVILGFGVFALASLH